MVKISLSSAVEMPSPLCMVIHNLGLYLSTANTACSKRVQQLLDTRLEQADERIQSLTQLLQGCAGKA